MFDRREIVLGMLGLAACGGGSVVPPPIAPILIKPKTIKEMLAELTGPTLNISGTFNELVALPNNVNLSGNAIIQWAGDPTDKVNMWKQDPLFIQQTNKISGITIVTQNSNYCLHSESGGWYKDFLQEIDGVYFRHLGNVEGAQGAAAVGIGMSSGGTVIFTNSKIEGVQGGLYIHNSPGQIKPCKLVGRNSLWRSLSPISADLTVHSIGSGTEDVVELDNMDIGDFLFYIVNVGNKAEFDIRGTVIRPFVFVPRGENIRYRPTIYNQEEIFFNNGAEILQGAGVEFGSKVGIALEDIKQSGRVQTSGWVSPELILTNDLNPKIGDGYSLVEGKFVIGGPLLKCIRAAAADGKGRFTPAILSLDS